MKILVIGGLHGNEPLGLAVCKKLEKLNLPYIDVLYGNPEAIKRNVRFVEEDLNRVFPGSTRGSLEARRAAEIVKLARGYDFAIDFHNTHCPDNDCTFLCSSSREVFQLPLFLGLKRIVLADGYDCVNKYVKNCVSVEISLDSPRFDVDEWVKKIVSLKDFDPKKIYGQPEWYEFERRISREEQEQFNFPKWKAFQPVPAKDLKPLGIGPKPQLYSIFIGDGYTPYSYAALLKKTKP